MKKIAIALFVLALGTSAAAGEELSRLKISAPQHPGATVRIVIHGCDGAVLEYNHSIIVPWSQQTDARLNDHGKATITALANDTQLRCNWVPGIPRPTWYGVQIVDGGKYGAEKFVKLRTGKTTKVKL